MEEGGDVHDLVAESFCFFFERGAGEDEVVFVEAGSTTSGVGDNGVVLGGIEGFEVFLSEFLRGGKVADVPGEGTAASLSGRDVDFDAVVGEGFDGGGVDVRIEDLLGAADEEGDFSLPGAFGWGDFRPGLFGWKGVRKEVEHGAEALGGDRGEDFGDFAKLGAEPETLGVWQSLGNEGAADFFEKRAFAILIGEGAEGGNEIPVGHTGGAGGFAGEAAEAGVEVWEGGFHFEFTFEDFFHEDNASTGGVHFLAEFLIGWASGEAESTMNTGLDSIRHGFAEWAVFFWINVVEHDDSYWLLVNG